MNTNLPSKFQYLNNAKQAGLKTPATIFLSHKNLNSNNLKNTLNRFIIQNKSDYYIVRSCIKGEDGNTKSFAGHFKSSKKITKENLYSTVIDFYTKNRKIQKKLIPKGETNLMIQCFIEGTIGGVLFSQWKYFTSHFLGEVSINGAEDAVSGKNSKFFLLSDNANFNDLIDFPKLPKNKLKKIIKQCKNIFNFPLDIEWIMQDNQIILLQIRPITRQLQALKQANKETVRLEKEYLQKTASGKWLMNSFSESFGIISPLSFTLIKQCFEENIGLFQKFGFKANKFNFLARSRNGQIYANPSKQSLFFKPKSFTAPFWQALRNPKYLQKISKFAKNYEINDNFELLKLYKIFGYWNIANFYAQQEKNISFISWTNEYELLQILNIDFPKITKKMRWSDWRNFYKQLWLWELNKLKIMIKENPLIVFSDKFISEKNINNSQNKINSFNAYQRELPYSILNFPYNFTKNEKHQKSICVVKTQPIKEKIFVVNNPKTFCKSFPEKCILVAPYFENNWILDIDKFKGIILENGGILSHSAIIAREKNIPYFINWTNACDKFKTGDKITL